MRAQLSDVKELQQLAAAVLCQLCGCQLAMPVGRLGESVDPLWLQCYAQRVTLVEEHYTNVLQVAVGRPRVHGVVQVRSPRPPRGLVSRARAGRAVPESVRAHAPPRVGGSLGTRTRVSAVSSGRLRSGRTGKHAAADTLVGAFGRPMVGSG